MMVYKNISIFALMIIMCLSTSGLAQDDYEKWLKKDQEQFKSFLAASALGSFLVMFQLKQIFN